MLPFRFYLTLVLNFVKESKELRKKVNKGFTDLEENKGLTKFS
jgi:hypothetical protein